MWNRYNYCHKMYNSFTLCMILLLSHDILSLAQTNGFNGPLPDYVQDWLSPETDEEKTEITESGIIGTLARGHVTGGENITSDLPRPLQMDITFSVHGEDVRLRLQKNPHVTSDVPVVLGNGSEIETWMQENDDFTMYSDLTNGASIMLQYHVTDDDTLLHTYSGSFNIGKDEYAVEPLLSSIPVPVTRRRRRRDAGQGQTKVKHIVFKRNSYLLTEGYETVESPERQRPEFGEREEGEREYGEEALVPKFPSYTIELLIVIDNSMYNRWYSASAASDLEQKKKNTLKLIKYYYAHVANGIDLRYSKIGSANYTIHTRLVGYYIATTEDASPFSRDNRKSGTPRGTLNGDAVLTDLSHWLTANYHRLPRHDQATLFTGDYIIGTSGSRILGIGVISGICSTYSVAISRDLGQYPAIQTSAHEMAHNLGAGHDGQSNECSSADQFIMAINPQPLTDDLYRNALTFSTCTQRDIGNTLRKLSQERNNCLSNRAMSLFDWNQLIKQLPGQMFTPDEQCQQIYGSDSYYCGGASEDKLICRRMECYSPSDGFCRSTEEQRAATGTTCGHKKWCQEGDCVENDLAPTANDFCTFGDYKGGYTSGLTCEKIKLHYPWKCYESYFYDDCCASCDVISVPIRGCEFGDRRNCSGVLPKDCLDPVTNADCCQTCQNIQACNEESDPDWCYDVITTSSDCYTHGGECCWLCGEYQRFQDVGCDYGDHRKDCTVRDCADAETRQECCETCADAADQGQLPETSTEQTEADICADIVPWCEVLIPLACYQADRVCCNTCRQFYTGIPDCEYGDQYKWCKPQFCESPGLRRECCMTCQYKNYLPSNVTSIIQSTSTSSPPSPTSHITSLATVSTTTTPKQSANPIQLIVPECRSTIPPTFCEKMPSRGCYLFSELCCEKCKREKYTGVQGCEYGDMAGWCPDVLKGPDDCINTSVSRDCCWTCRMYSLQSQDCYGPDMHHWCSNISPADCYTHLHTCCSTCSRFLTHYPGCPFGNREMWCEKHILDYPNSCSDPFVSSQCCSSCSKT